MMPGIASLQARSATTLRGADLATLPNLLSVARIVGVATAVLLYFAGHPLATVVIGTTACLTDHLDGYLARRLGQETTLGAMLDQAADSFTTAIALAMLVIAGGFPFVYLIVFLAREFWVGTVRRYAAMEGREIPSHVTGKVATGFMYYSMFVMAVILMIGLPDWLGWWLRPLAYYGMAFGLAMSCYSGWRYTLALARKEA